MKQQVIQNIKKHVIPAKAGIHIILTVLISLFGSALCLADDPTVAQLQQENLDLKNKNAALVQSFNDIFNDRRAILKLLQQRQDKQILPDVCKLKKKLEEAELELMKEKNTDEKLEKQVATMHYNLGVIYQTQNKYDESIKEFENDLSVNPNDADAHYNLALIYDKDKNNRQEAINHYNMYLELEPDAQDALQVKEHLTDLATQQKVWGNPDAAGINEKQDLGRL